ncbi:hypothetical protein Vafri_18455 [Volvox africanus]|uniref:Uncharacterized protein n=1 Tax=Volvox africanus TaxID=51714 RepID=A0A8J4BLA0_9CHLO|nr:hypothetical protein Vafri_18455 [Volvox africanus]
MLPRTGSRERFKWVMQYDSYRFESQRWKILACHFCSIDTWLDGLCHPKHPELWQPRRRMKQQQQQQGSTSSEGAWATVRVTRGIHGTGRNTWDTGKHSTFGRVRDGGKKTVEDE